MTCPRKYRAGQEKQAEGGQLAGQDGVQRLLRPTLVKPPWQVNRSDRIVVIIPPMPTAWSLQPGQNEHDQEHESNQHNAAGDKAKQAGN
jgi:hypothetical protein